MAPERLQPFAEFTRGRTGRHAAILVVVLGATACEPPLNVGSWQCNTGRGVTVPGEDEVAPVPWTTGFESGFCDYEPNFGFCYAAPGAAFEIVTSPVYSGRRAAAFTVSSDDEAAQQTRCVRQGVLPRSAYYSARYFLPQPVVSEGNWNLLHFQGGDAESGHSLWDVSLVSGADGALRVQLFDFLHQRPIPLPDAPPVPIGVWVHLQVYWLRSPDPDGVFAVYQDGVEVVRLTELNTDDTEWGQYYVGNLATALEPSTYTLYVDDVRISETR